MAWAARCRARRNRRGSPKDARHPDDGADPARKTPRQASGSAAHEAPQAAPDPPPAATALRPTPSRPPDGPDAAAPALWPRHRPRRCPTRSSARCSSCRTRWRAATPLRSVSRRCSCAATARASSMLTRRCLEEIRATCAPRPCSCSAAVRRRSCAVSCRRLTLEGDEQDAAGGLARLCREPLIGKALQLLSSPSTSRSSPSPGWRAEIDLAVAQFWNRTPSRRTP